ncbi:DUF2510 domain-containing protein [Mycobacterium sp. AMU20-3851]|uniref:DUF2510 domain-containing protein n=1 Tax=Mycobacterium sp. AMU20-3851 TaxID=3122055 RepID=UPI003754BC54
MTNATSGWYRDPCGHAELRRWTGSEWTSRTQGPPLGAGESERRRGGSHALVAGSYVGDAAGVVLAAVPSTSIAPNVRSRTGETTAAPVGHCPSRDRGHDDQNGSSRSVSRVLGQARIG